MSRGQPSNATKHEMLDFINSFIVQHDKCPTVDDIAARLNRPRKVVADFVSRYVRYGILDAFKEQGQKTRYGPGINWVRVNHLEWQNFFRAGKCPHCSHNGVLGFVGPKTVRYRCKWCREEWSESMDWVSKDTLIEIERQAQRTKRQWSH